MTDRILPLVNGRRVIYHLPFGNDTADDEAMEFHGLIELLDSGLGWIADSWMASVRSVCRAGATEVVAYIGSPHNSRMLRSLLLDPWRLDDAFRFIARCLRPITNLAKHVNISICLDNASSLGLPKPFAGLIEFIAASLYRSENQQLYIEATTEYSSLFFDAFPMLIHEDLFYKRHDPEHHNHGIEKRFPLALSEKWYTREVVAMMFQGAYPTVVRAKERMDELTRQGASIAVNIGLAEMLKEEELWWP